MTNPSHTEFGKRIQSLGGTCHWSDGRRIDDTFPAGLRAVAGDLLQLARSSRKPAVSGPTDGQVVVAFPDFQSASPLVVFPGPDAGRTVPIATHYFNDLRQAAEHRRESMEFAEKLGQSFEEVNLIFRMANVLHGTEDPCGVMRTMCNDLGDVLPFGWLAIRFAGDSRVLPHLRDTLILFGDAPTPGFASQLQTLVDQPAGPLIRVPAGCELAAATGAEILVQPVLHESAVIGLIVAGSKRGNDPDVSSNETQLVSAAAGFLGLFHENASRFARQRALFLGTLQALTAAVDAKDPYTRGHSDRVGLLASQTAAAMGLPPAVVESYRIAGLLHDVGKIGVPEAVLRKPGRLTDEEFGQIKTHPDTGFRILKDIESLADINPGVLSHHERWDGNGYPQKLVGEEIPPIARVLALADTFDAMSSNRSYRAGLPRAKVLSEIARSAGTQFDPRIVPYFLSLDFTQFDALLAEAVPQSLAAA